MPCDRAAAATVFYTYDSNGRVATALYDNGACVVYAYDPAGNQTSRTVAGYDAPGAGVWGTATVGSFSWASAAVSPVWGSGIYGCFRWSS
jgi:YD repeat-containing protein